MQVETFECSEVASEPVDATAEAVELIESLGLTGQRRLVCPAKAEGQNTRSPYRQMYAAEAFVYGVLCPKHEEIADYSATPIPLRVLQVAAHAKSLMPDCRLFVWDKADVSEKDPVLIAECGAEYAWQSGFSRLILARWGEELEAFSVLVKRAISIRRESLRQQAVKVMSEVESATDDDVMSNSRDVSW